MVKNGSRGGRVIPMYQQPDAQASKVRSALPAIHTSTHSVSKDEGERPEGGKEVCDELLTGGHIYLQASASKTQYACEVQYDKLWIA